MHSSRSYYPPDPYAVHQQQSQVMPGGGQYGNQYTSQHNHPTYYGDPVQSSASYYDQAYSQTHHNANAYQHPHHQESVYGTNTHPQAGQQTANYYGARSQPEISSYPPA